MQNLLKVFQKEYALNYKDELEKFKLAVMHASTVSYGGVGILTSHARETYCSIIFTKLVVTNLSILKLCPDPAANNYAESALDFTAIASLSRVVIDTFIALYHFGLEDCSEEEYQTRQLLLFWRDHRVRGKMGMPQSTSGFDHEKDIKERLALNSFWQTVPEKRQRHLLKSNDILHSPYDVMKRAGFDPEFNKQIYSYWSAHTHCDSVAFLRMIEQNRGRGIVNEIDLSLTAVCLEYLTKILNYSSDKVDNVLIGSEYRGYSVKTFDPLKLINPSPPWEGSLTMANLKKSNEQFSSES